MKEEIKKYTLKPSKIVNMDEFPISFDMSAPDSADFVNLKSVSIVTTGNEKNSTLISIFRKQIATDDCI